MSHHQGQLWHVAHSRNKRKRYYRPPGFAAKGLVTHELAVENLPGSNYSHT